MLLKDRVASLPWLPTVAYIPESSLSSRSSSTVPCFQRARERLLKASSEWYVASSLLVASYLHSLPFMHNAQHQVISCKMADSRISLAGWPTVPESAVTCTCTRTTSYPSYFDILICYSKFEVSTVVEIIQWIFTNRDCEKRLLIRTEYNLFSVKKKVCYSQKAIIVSYLLEGISTN